MSHSAGQRLCFRYVDRQFLYFLNPNFNVSSHLLWLYIWCTKWVKNDGAVAALFFTVATLIFTVAMLQFTVATLFFIFTTLYFTGATVLLRLQRKIDRCNAFNRCIAIFYLCSVQISVATLKMPLQGYRYRYLFFVDIHCTCMSKSCKAKVLR